MTDIVDETTPALEERALLVSLNVGAWSGSMTDQEVTDKTIVDYHAEKGAGRWVKQLIAAKYLRPVGSKISTVRTTHRVLTLPWEDRGARILATQAFLTYVEQIRLGRVAVEAAARETFDVERLIEYKAEARQRLGKQYREEDFPTAEAILAKFYVDTEFRPIPKASDFRVKLADKTVKAVMKDIEKRTEERLKKATADVYARIVDVTEKMVERLAAYQPAAGPAESSSRFRDSLVWNVKELADLLPALNINSDPKLATMQQSLLALTEYSPTVLRIDEHARRTTAKQAEKLLAKAKQYLA